MCDKIKNEIPLTVMCGMFLTECRDKEDMASSNGSNSQSRVRRCNNKYQKVYYVLMMLDCSCLHGRKRRRYGTYIYIYNVIVNS